jgi:hypothetical protein
MLFAAPHGFVPILLAQFFDHVDPGVVESISGDAPAADRFATQFRLGEALGAGKADDLAQPAAADVLLLTGQLRRLAVFLVHGFAYSAIAPGLETSRSGPVPMVRTAGHGAAFPAGAKALQVPPPLDDPGDRNDGYDCPHDHRDENEQFQTGHCFYLSDLLTRIPCDRSMCCRYCR